MRSEGKRVRCKIFQSDSSFLLCKVSGDTKEDSPVDKCHLSVKSAADYSNATLTEDANRKIPLCNDICQADTAVTMDINNDDHSYAASTAKYAENDCFQVDHSYNLKSPRTLKWKNQDTEQIL